MKCYKCNAEMKCGRFVNWDFFRRAAWLPEGKSFFNIKDRVSMKDSNTSYYCEKCKIVIVEMEDR